MRDARPEVTRRIDRVASRPSERESYGPDKETDEQCREARRKLVAHDGQDTEDEHERTDHLADEVRHGVPDRRSGGEDGQLEARVVGLRPMRQVMQVDDHGADECADHLAADVPRHEIPPDPADRRQTDRHGRVQVRPRQRADRVDADRDGECPPGGDHDPARVLGLGSCEEDAGDDTVAKNDEESGADDLGEHDLEAIGQCAHAWFPLRAGISRPLAATLDESGRRHPPFSAQLEDPRCVHRSVRSWSCPLAKSGFSA